MRVLKKWSTAACSTSLMLAAGLSAPRHAQAELPAACFAGSCGTGNPANFVSAGQASAATTGNNMVVQQSTSTAVLNWRSFNIGADSSVQFKQPDANSVAVNRIFQQDPSLILGQLTANGQIYLLNQNGIVFGNGARVDVGGLIASSLKISEQALQSGLLAPFVTGQPAFEAARDDQGNATSGAVKVEAGASLEAAAGGRIFLIAPSVTNEGVINTPDGQAVLAAGNKAYLFASDDPALRGLMVEVEEGGEVTHRAVAGAPANSSGVITADRGNVTLVGLAVNQAGRISANTSVRANGSVRLLARDVRGVVPTKDYDKTGTVTLGAGSEISLLPDLTTTDKTVDGNAQPQSSVEIQGNRIVMESGSSIVATSGKVSLLATRTPGLPIGGPQDDSRIYLANGSTIDVSGSTVELAMESNVVTAELRADEVKDSPLLQNSPLRGKKISVDIRARGTRADGSTWVGTPLADVSGAIAGIQRGIGERTTLGGSISLQSAGDVITAAGSRLDVSGGAVKFLDGFIGTSRVISADGRIFDVSQADRDRVYGAIADGYVSQHARWGVNETYPGFGSGLQGAFEAGYTEGRDAGTISVAGPQIALNGQVRGDTIAGRNQRSAPTAVAANQTRLWNELPLGGQLLVGSADGTDAVLRSDIELAAGSGDSLGAGFNPLTDPFPEAVRSLVLSPDALANSGMSRLSLFSLGRIVLPEASTLTLAPAGSLTARAGAVEIAGHINVPSGTVSLRTLTVSEVPREEAGIRVTSTGSIDVSGLWINENPLAGEQTPGPLLVDGGSINISGVLAPVTLDSGARLSASAGAWIRPNLSTQLGRGGNITLGTSGAAGGQDASPLTLGGATLEAFGFQNGGTLTLNAPDVCITSGAECSGMSETATTLDGAFFKQGGFSRYSLTAYSGGAQVTSGTEVRLEQQNLELLPEYLSVATGAQREQFARVTRLDDLHRGATNLSLRAVTTDLLLTANNLEKYSVRLDPGSLLVTDPQGSIDLQSNASLFIGGTILAPAGSIGLTLRANAVEAEFLDSQAIWLGDTARLLAGGAVRSTTSDAGRVTGTVLSAGSVNVTAERGYLVTAQNSVVDVSGASAVFDLPAAAGTPGTTVATPVAGKAGSIKLQAAEGMLLAGTLSGRAALPGAAGGSLSVVMDAGSRAEPETPIFPRGARSIELVQGSAPTIISIGSTIPRRLNGVATLAADDIMEGGFHELSLAANSISMMTGVTSGLITWSDDVALSLPRSISLDAGAYAGTGGRLELNSNFVQLANTQAPAIVLTFPQVARNDSELAVNARLIDVAGRVSVLGAGSVELNSSGDIRARGLQSLTGDDQRTLLGSLTVPGDLILNAAQIYPTTLSHFDITAGSTDEAGSITVKQNGVATDVLSAVGALTLRAASIDIDGTVKAPFGSITAIGDTVHLGSHANVSVSGAGTLVPFGSTQVGIDWIYPLLNNQTLVFDGKVNQLPEKQIQLQGDSVLLDAGATVDLRGGGDLLAAEFVSGVSGTRDFLDPTSNPQAFAVVPAFGSGFAPYDEYYSRGTTVRPGDSVYLSGIDGLPAGEYVKLPAKYALLPGAFLVTPVAGYQDLLPSDRAAIPGGPTIVSGYNLLGGTSIRDSRTNGFAVMTQAELGKQALYVQTKANEFFSNPERLEAGAAARLPRDAGALQLSAVTNLTLDARLRAEAAEKGRGATLDLAADRIAIVGDGGPIAGPVDGVLSVRASDLNALGVESLLIGGRRQTLSGQRTIATQASEVSVESGATLQGPEILLTANQQLGVDGSVSASGAKVASPESIKVNSAGAVLAATTGDYFDLIRSSDVVSGAFTLGQSGSVSASGAVILDVGSDVELQGTVAAPSGTLALAASAVSLGSAPVDTAGLVLSSAALQNLGGGDLRLRSRGLIDVYDGLNLQARSVVLDSAGLRNLGAPDSAVAINAQRISLTNSRGATGGALPVGATLAAGGLQLHASDRLSLGGGTFDLSGFSVATLTAPTTVGKDTATVRFANASSVTFATSTLTAANGASLSLDAGSARLAVIADTTSPASVAQPGAEEGLGAQLRLTGASVDVSTAIRARSGLISLEANGAAAADGVNISSGGTIDVSGRDFTFDGQLVSLRGGQVSMRSANGDVSVAGGATVNVAGGSQAAGGHLELAAARGTVVIAGQLSGSGATTGGTASVDALRLDDFAAINHALDDGGFTGALSYRQRQGSLLIGDDVTIKAERVEIASGGDIDIRGDILAQSANGGSVGLFANNVFIAGTIDARASTAGKGGTVNIGATGTAVNLRNSASILVGDLAGGDTGLVTVRAPRAAWESVLAPGVTPGIQLAGSIRGARQILGEAFASYALPVDGTGTAIVDSDIVFPGSAIHQDATTFMAFAPAIDAALAQTGNLIRVRPGVELTSTGDMRLTTDWNLADWRFNDDQPGMLTLRAGGDLIFDASLSDGFVGADSFATTLLSGDSWSYRLVAGADLSATSPMTVRAVPGVEPTGSVIVSAGTPGTEDTPGTLRMVRTGTGGIEIAAALDVVLENRASVIYTAGRARTGDDLFPFFDMQFPEQGGSIDIRAGRDVVGADPVNSMSAWLWRIGFPGDEFLRTAWDIYFPMFEHNVGALGGGNVRVVAGRDVRSLSVMAPTVAVGSADGPTQLGGGDIMVRAERDVIGGVFYAARGNGRIEAGHVIGAPVLQNEQPGLAPTLALGDGRFALEAGAGIRLESVLNPTLLRQSPAQFADAFASYFLTYSETSAVDLVSAAGDVVLSNNTSALESIFHPTAIGAGARQTLELYPGSLRAVAASGSLDVEHSFEMTPSSQGNLELFAAQDVRLLSGTQILMSDADITLLPSTAAPTETTTSLSDHLRANAARAADVHASTPVHAAGGTGPVRVVARDGDIVFAPDTVGTFGGSSLTVPKAARLTAGRDLVNVRFQGQNLRGGDITLLSAGRDIRNGLVRLSNGALQPNERSIILDGPGRLEIAAGGNINLGTSIGIATRGNTVNPFLAALGAGVGVLVGMNGEPVGEQAFATHYFAESTMYDEALIAYVALIKGGNALSKDAALAAFRALEVDQQLPLIRNVLFAELRASGRSAASTGSNDYTRGFTAINALFPLLEPVNAGQNVDPNYTGDLSMFFSRIYTLDGGDIDVLAPGGGISVGLAATPTSLGLGKGPTELGMVTQSVGDVRSFSLNDFLVNESRVFAADSGNILIWVANGDIDAGRGAKTAISAPPPTITVNENGGVEVTFPPALTGSGIRAFVTSKGAKPGDVDLFAPFGAVIAGDAGIGSAGNVTIGAVDVIGADNIDVGGVGVGISVDTSNVSAGIASAGNATAATQSGTEELAGTKAANDKVGEAALSWLDVFVEGFGEEACKPNDTACMERSQKE